jgi:hypothetical protein
VGEQEQGIEQWRASYEAECKRGNQTLKRAEAAEARVWELTKTYTDENGTVWSPPTAWAYYAACKALAAKEAATIKLRDAADAFDKCLSDYCDGEERDRLRAAIRALAEKPPGGA